MLQFFAGAFLGVAGMGIAMLLGTERDDAKNSEMVRAAQDMEIGEGVTLAQGLKAYFGGETFWKGSDGTWVRAMAGMNGPAASVYISPKTGEVKIFTHDRNEILDGERRDLLLAEMVRKVKEEAKAETETDETDS